jgi:hypothetical protein
VNYKHLLLALAILLLAAGRLANPMAAHAAPHATYVLVQSYTGPGGSGSAGIYTLSSSIGQPTAGEVSAGSYTFGGGFWGGGVIVPVANNYDLYLPLTLR